MLLRETVGTVTRTWSFFFRVVRLLPINKDTFEPDLLVKWIYVPAAKAHCSGWAFEAVQRVPLRPTLLRHPLRRTTLRWTKTTGPPPFRWTPPLLDLRRTPPSRRPPLPRTPLRRTDQHFALFSPLPPHFRSFFLFLGVFSCFFLSGGLIVSFFFSLEVFSLNFGTLKCARLGSLGTPPFFLVFFFVLVFLKVLYIRAGQRSVTVIQSFRVCLINLATQKGRN